MERMKNPLRSPIYCRYIASFIGKYVEVDHRMKEMRVFGISRCGDQNPGDF